MNNITMLAWPPPKFYTDLVNTLVGSASIFVILSTVFLALGLKYYRVLTTPMPTLDFPMST